MKGIAIRVIKQTKNDRRTLAMIMFAPLIIITLVFFLLGDSSYIPTIAIDKSSSPTPLITALSNDDINLVDLPTESYSNAKEYLKENKNIDLIVQLNKTGTDLFIIESTTKSAKAIKSFQNALSNMSQASKITTHMVYNENANTFDSIGFVLLAFFAFFFVFVISGMALVRERVGGTLERLLMTPIKRFQVTYGYTIGYGFFAIIQSALIVFYSIFILKISNEGSIFLIFISMFLNALVAVAFGEFISIFSTSEMQVVQFIPILIIPQAFFSGLIPLDTIPFHLGKLSLITPVYYSAESIRRVMVEGKSLDQIWYLLVALILFFIFINTINTFALKKYRTL